MKNVLNVFMAPILLQILSNAFVLLQIQNGSQFKIFASAFALLTTIQEFVFSAHEILFQTQSKQDVFVRNQIPYGCRKTIFVNAFQQPQIILDHAQFAPQVLSQTLCKWPAYVMIEQQNGIRT